MSVLEKRFLTPEAVYPSLTDNNLRYEIEYQSFLNWWKENPNYFDSLSFRIENQTNLFLEQCNKEGMLTALNQLRMDLYGYYLEYILQEGVIPFSLRFNNSGRLVGEFYGDKPIVEMIDGRERNGAVLKAMNDLEKKLKVLEQGEIVFRISPAGWTGLDYDYKETQAQVLWKDKEGKIRGLTIRTQIHLQGILSIISSLGVDIPCQLISGDETNLVSYITSLNITCDWPLLELIEFLTDKFNYQDHRKRDLRSQINNWWHEDYDFKHFDEIAGLIDFLEKRIKKLVDVNYSAEEIKKELKGLISFVLVGMVSGRGKSEDDSWKVCFYPDTRFLPDNYYDQAVIYLQSLTGCAGGGSAEKGFLLTPFGTVTIFEDDKYGSREFECPHCHKTVLRPEGELLDKCPYCGENVKCD